MRNNQKSSAQKRPLTDNARSVALETLIKCESSGQYSNIALDNALKKSELSDSDKGLASALFYGVIERRITLDYYISKLSARPLCEIDERTRETVRLGLYQLIYLDRVPDHAAINETVALCTAKTKGFVNALLRSYTREKGTQKLALPDASEGVVRYLSVKYSVGERLAEKFVEIFGEERCESIFASLCDVAGTTLRTNTLKISRDELCEKLGAEKTRYSVTGVSTSGKVASLYGFDEGLFFVQDEASQICTAALGAKSGECVIDTCSCPGSKSFGAAIDMNNEGKVYSFDLHANKLSLVESSAKRLGIGIIETEERDGRKPREELLGKADRVLCDVPCSGFGVLGKKPELRYKDPAASAALPDIQLAILEASSNYVKNGGVLVYSTCTVLPEENEKNIERFLASHKEFELCGFEVGELDCPEGMITLLPDEHGTDGFFVAKMVKKNL